MTQWRVRAPGPLVERAPGLWTVDDDVPGLPGTNRRMSVVRRPGGELLFFNAVPVTDAVLSQLRALGRPAQLVLPNQFHALDAADFVKVLGVTAYAPDVACAELARRVVARPAEELPLGEDLQRFCVEGFRTREVVLVARRSLLVGDLLTNQPHRATVVGLLLRLVGFTGPGPMLPRPVLRRVGRDLPQVAALLRSLAGLELERLVPSHGEVLEGGVAQALRRVADQLG